MSTETAVHDTAAAETSTMSGLDALATAVEVEEQEEAAENDSRSTGRSSSLSEFEEEMDETNQTNEDSEAEADLPKTEVVDDDTEAETVRLEATPQKAKPKLLASDKHNHRMADVEEEDEEDDEEEEDDDEDEDITRSTNRRKRKRSSEASAENVEGDPDEPAAKRSHSSAENLHADEDVAIDSGVAITARDEDEEAAAEEELSEIDEGHAGEEEAAAEGEAGHVAEGVAEEDEEEEVLAPQPKTRGKRKSRRQKGVDPEVTEAPSDAPEDVDEEAAEEQEALLHEGDDDEAEAAAKEEELAKKKAALEALAAIEKQFVAFRMKLYEQKISELDQEQKLLRQPEPLHREYAGMIRALDLRRDDKIELENTRLKYELQALSVRTKAGRSQVFSQYFQEVREERERIIAELNSKLYRIQKERRQMVEGPSYTYMFPTKRSQQILNQTAYNLEVSVLSGVAKYVGFPSAPEINGARSTEIDEDLKAMRMDNAPAVVSQYTRQLTEREMQHPERLAAGERFFEQTPWANPQHPVHQQMPPMGVTAFASQEPVGNIATSNNATLNTPTPRRIPIEQAMNGSAPTTVQAEPPSSTLAVAATDPAAPRLKHMTSLDTITDPEYSGNSQRPDRDRAITDGVESPLATHSQRVGEARVAHHETKAFPFEAMPASGTDNDERAAAAGFAFPQRETVPVAAGGFER